MIALTFRVVPPAECHCITKQNPAYERIGRGVYSDYDSTHESDCNPCPAWRWDLALDDDLHVGASHMSRPQAPAPVRTNLPNRLQHRIAAHPVKAIRRLIHMFQFDCDPSRSNIQWRRSVCAVLPIHRAGLIAMKVAAVAGKSDQVRHDVDSGSPTTVRAATVRERWRQPGGSGRDSRA